MATGMLKFSPNNTVYIDLDLENHTANKAVDIDAEGREWPICGGGGGAFRIFKATLTNVGQNILQDIEFMFNNMYYKLPDLAPGEHGEVWLPVIGDSIYLANATFSNVTGNAEILVDDPYNVLVATGDFTADIDGAIE